MPTPGLMYVGASIKDPVLEEAAFEKWYNEIHLPEILAVPNAPPAAAFRYKNTNPSVPFPFLTLYGIPDIAWVNSPELKNTKMSHDTLPGGRSHFELCDFDVRTYEKIQTFEGQIPKEGRTGKCVIAVAMEPAAGDEAEADFDAWYRLQHLDMLSTVSGYRRSTRYKLLASPTAEMAGKLGEVSRYLALHEYDGSEIPPEQIRLAVGTEWSKKVIGGAKAFVRDTWVLTHEAGDASMKL